MLSKKHYVAIASVLEYHKDQQAANADLKRLGVTVDEWTADRMLRVVTEDLANYFAFDNPSFNRDRFLAAVWCDG